MLELSKVLSEMANQQDEDFVSYSVTDKFNPHVIPNTQDQTETTVNSMDKSFRTYIIDFETESGILMLPMSFANNFRNEIEEYANLMDKNRNSFEMKVDKMAECIVLTTGCGALCDFYNISTGVWITLIYMGAGNFGIKKIRSKNKKKMVLPVYDPPMRFEIDRDVNHGVLFDGILESVHQLSYRHNPNNFSIYYERLLQQVDINSGFLARDYIDISFRYNTICLCRICLTNNIISSY